MTPGVYVHRQLEGDPRAITIDMGKAQALANELIGKLRACFPNTADIILIEAANEPFRRLAARRRWYARRTNKPVTKKRPYGRTIGEPGEHYHLTKGWSGQRQHRRI